MKATTTKNACLCQSFEFISAVSECADSVNIEGVFPLTDHRLSLFLARYMNFLVCLLAVIYFKNNNRSQLLVKCQTSA